MTHKYTLPPDNVIALDENSEIRQKKRDYFLGLTDEGIDWPVEFQGSGKSDFKKREFKIYYPTGDLFLSTTIAIHELGHLRQGETDARFAVEALGAPKISVMGELEYHKETEADAYQRGWDRAQKYCPEFLQVLELKFSEHKKSGKLNDFENFRSFFNYIVKVGLRITELIDQTTQEMGNIDDDRQEGRVLGRHLKQDGVVNAFFSQPAKWRVGKNVDRKEMEGFIKKMAEHIAEEEYPT